MSLLPFAKLLALLPVAALAACGGPPDDAAADNPSPNSAAAASGHDGKVVTLSADQIAAAGIQVAPVSIGGSAGAIELPATIVADPRGIRIVSAAIGGRLVSLAANLGQAVRRGEMLAVIESREAAQMKGEIEAARARAALARSNLRREQRLFAERVSPEQDLVAARSAAAEADIALRQARQQLAAAGTNGGALNRIAIPSPIGGTIIARSAIPGQTVAADAELYRVANLATLSLAIALSPADADMVRPGATIRVMAAGRTGSARITFVSPVLDDQTRLVSVLATIDNRAGNWRVGENVQAAILLPDRGNRMIGVPQVALQILAGKPVLFVRTPAGFRAVQVRTGATEGDRVTILAGLSGAERIATVNSFTLKSELGKSAEEEE